MVGHRPTRSRRALGREGEIPKTWFRSEGTQRDYGGDMPEPSQYELDAWNEIRQFKGRRVSGAWRQTADTVVDGAASVAERAEGFLESHPRTQALISGGAAVAAKGGRLVGAGAQKLGDSMPSWARTAGSSASQGVARISRVGLSPKRVVAKHKKYGHDVSSLGDLRRLDLQKIDAVRGRLASWLYPSGAALSGAGAGLAITGGEVAVTVSAGATAAPSGAVVAGAYVGDAAMVLALSSRVVSRTALMYGYDPESSAEKLFIMSVVNAGSALSAGAKTAAFADVSRLTQALVRNKTWKVLNESVVSTVANSFAKSFSIRLTKQGLGKVVPVAGVVLGGALNWATIDGVLDAADLTWAKLVRSSRLADGVDRLA